MKMSSYQIPFGFHSQNEKKGEKRKEKCHHDSIERKSLNQAGGVVYVA
jgi:hypothetical protein